jgi:hypothetical protein
MKEVSIADPIRIVKESWVTGEYRPSLKLTSENFCMISRNENPRPESQALGSQKAPNIQRLLAF